MNNLCVSDVQAEWVDLHDPAPAPLASLLLLQLLSVCLRLLSAPVPSASPADHSVSHTITHLCGAPHSQLGVENESHAGRRSGRSD